MLNDPYAFLNRHVNVSRETFEKLELYCQLLLKWQSKINLISHDSIPDIWNRHFLDSIQLTAHLPDLSKKMVDMGTGAGFPGMALAICGYQDIHLIESDAKKITFLREVSRITGTKVTIHHNRIEECQIENVDIILARACSSLNQLLNYGSHFVSHETIFLFHKGKNYSTELEDALKHWQFDHVVMASVTDKEGAILKLSHVRKRS